MNFGTRGCMYCEGECNKECLSQKEPKQETLEEAAKKYKDLKLPDDLYDAFIQGANWQAKRMYTEEEVLKLLCAFDSNFNQNELYMNEIEKWFKQHKKK